MERMTPDLLRTYWSRTVSPVIVEARTGAFNKVRGQLKAIVPLDMLQPKFGFLPRLTGLVEVPFSKWKEIPTFNMVATVLTPELIEEVAQWGDVEKVYPDYTKFALQVVPPQGVYKDHKGVPFTSTYWTKRLMGLDRANEKGFTGRDILAVVIDSVPNYSPIIIKDENFSATEILPIEDLWEKLSEPTVSLVTGEEIKECRRDIRIFTRTKKGNWVKIKKITRHFYEGTIVRINTVGGVVDVTPNHSLITHNRKATVVGGHNKFIGRGIASAKEVKVGDLLSMPNLEPSNPTNSPKGFFVGTEELAWLYGFFTAEGSAYKVRGNDKTHPNGTFEVSFSNEDEGLLSKVEKIFWGNFHSNLGRTKSTGAHKLHVRSKSIYYFFRENFYTKNGDKKVPSFILDSPQNIRLSFLRGYNDGDGSKPHGRVHWEFNNFTTNSQTLAMGLLWLIKATTKQPHRVYVREDKNRIIQIVLNLSSNTKEQRQKVKKIMSLPYSGWVYDVETEEGDETFTTGVGPIRVHNTGARATHEQLGRVRILTAMAEKGGSGVDSNGHGSWCCSCVGGARGFDRRYNVPVEGMALHCNLTSIQALGFILGMGSSSDIISAMETCIGLDARVVSMSLGSNDAPKDEDNPEAVAVNALAEHGIVPCIAAGNSGPSPSSVGSPGSCLNALTVAAEDPLTGKIADFSSRGPTSGDGYTKPDMSSPGVRINSALVAFLDSLVDPTQPKYGSISGTSMSTPHVAGCVTCMAQLYEEVLKKRLTVHEVKRMMEVTAKEPKNNDSGWGFLTWDRVEEYVSTEYGFK